MKKILSLVLFTLAFWGCSGTNNVDVQEIIIEGGTITSPTTWDGKYLINDSITIDTNITIAKCSVIRVASNVTITVGDNGSIKSIGTADCPVKFTSSKAIQGKGDWQGFDIYNSSATDSEFTYTIFEYAGRENYGAMWVQSNAHVKLSNSVFSNIKGDGIDFQEGAVINQFTGNTFKNVELYPIKIAPEQVKSLNPIVTENNDLNTVFVYNGSVTSLGTWKNLSIPYEMESINLNAPITIEAGTVFYMKQGSTITVDTEGSIKSIGTVENPVVFTSVKTSPAKGDWVGFEFYETSSNDNEFNNTIIEYAGSFNNYGAIWVQSQADIEINNTEFFEIKGVAIDFEDGANINSFIGNTFENIEDSIMKIAPEQVKSLSPITSINNLKDTISVIDGETETTGTWENLLVDYEIGSLNIKNETITVGAGVTLYLRPNASITITDGGALKLMGTETEHISVLSSKTAPAGGDWDSIYIYETSSNDNEFNYTDIQHGGSNGYGQLWLDEGAYIILNDVVFSDGDVCDISGTGTIDDTNSEYDICD
jgi:hypothetical protein